MKMQSTTEFLGLYLLGVHLLARSILLWKIVPLSDFNRGCMEGGSRLTPLVSLVSPLLHLHDVSLHYP